MSQAEGRPPAAERPGGANGRNENTLTRRQILAGLGGAAGALVVGIPVGMAIGAGVSDGGGETAGGGGLDLRTPTPGGIVPAVVTAYPRLKIGSVSALKVGDSIDFNYPTTSAQASLFRLGRPAAGGIGPEGDIVAFSTICTHMGCPLAGVFKKEHGTLGPCSCHLTTFDLGLRGQVVIGQATENLPQVLLDIDGDDIYAVGTIGLLYGYRENLADVPVVKGI